MEKKGWKPCDGGGWALHGERILADAVVYPSDAAPGYTVAIVGVVLRSGVASLADAKYLAEMALELPPETLSDFMLSH